MQAVEMDYLMSACGVSRMDEVAGVGRKTPTERAQATPGVV